MQEVLGDAPCLLQLLCACGTARGSTTHHFHIPESITTPTKTRLLLYQRSIPDSTFRNVQATIIAAVNEPAASFDFGANGACKGYEC